MATQETLAGRPTVLPQLDEDTRKLLDEVLRMWDNHDTAVLTAFEESQAKWAEIIDPLIRAISSSEQLTKEDLAVRINTRD